jgi:VanZ family protein
MTWSSRAKLPITRWNKTGFGKSLTQSQKEILKVWIAAGLWMGIITAESSTLGGSNNTSRVFYPIFHFLFGMNPSQFAPWHTVIRKTGHFVGYFTLSLLLFRAWRATLAQPGIDWLPSWAGIAWMMTTVVASLDEWHQAYIPGRGSSVHDVALDSTAALAAQLVIWWMWRKRLRSRV